MISTVNNVVPLPSPPWRESRTVPVRFSTLKQMALSPAHYVDSIQSDWEQTLAMRLGSGAHALLLGKPVAVFTGKVRNGKAWNAFREEHAHCVILNRSEYEQAVTMVLAIESHRLAAELLDCPNIERELHWKHELHGRQCRSTPDAFDAVRVVELKTGKSSSPDRFVRDARWRSYHAQLAFYQEAVLRSDAGTPSEAYIVAVESSRPHPVTVLRLTDRAIDQGRRLCRLWMERLLVCETFNRWPQYAEEIVPFDVDDDGEFSLRIDGEELDIE